MSTQWFLEYDSGEKYGSISTAEALQYVQENANGYAWTEGFSAWKPIVEVPELTSTTTNTTFSPPLRAQGSSLNAADEIDYTIFGNDIQYVEIELDPGESAISEAGAMMYKNSHIMMDTVFGDGSGSKEDTGGLFDKLVGAGKRLVTGESLFTTVFTHTGTDKATVAFGAPYPGRIIPVNLEEMGGTLICQKDCFFMCCKRSLYRYLFSKENFDWTFWW